jgi:transketolase
MRNAFVKALTEVAASDARVVLLTADLGFKIFDDFANRYPGRFMNVGVAEANMVGMASGMALEGLRPFVYSIVPFATMRCFEQIRNDLAYHNADVTVVGVGGGYSYGHNGPTHHGVEDIALLRALPRMTVLCPGDPAETIAAVRALAQHTGPAYLRLGRAGEPDVHRTVPTLTIGKGIPMREGPDIALLPTGNMLTTAMTVAGLLAASGIGARVISMPSVKPLDVEVVERAARETRGIVTLEEHSLIGGLGSAVAEYIAEGGLTVRFRRFATPDQFVSTSGDQEFLRHACGLGAEQIASAIASFLKGGGCHR